MIQVGLSALLFTLVACADAGPITWHGGLSTTGLGSPVLLEPHAHHSSDCEIYKVIFDQSQTNQLIQYKTDIPEMKEFTLCLWAKFADHVNDHPLFSYSAGDQPREIYAWIANANSNSSFFSLAVAGHTLYRLNYPLKMHKWYHICKSWNGKTGEWQIWVNAERVGRGFHNRLVGYKISPGGVAVSGQEQRASDGSTKYNQPDHLGIEGMSGEITMVQLYRVALTAGKAHKNHKHHHAHKYDKFGNIITTPAPTTPIPRPTLPTHPLLTGGQINKNARLNVIQAGPQLPQPAYIPISNQPQTFASPSQQLNLLSNDAQDYGASAEDGQQFYFGDLAGSQSAGPQIRKPVRTSHKIIHVVGNVQSDNTPWSHQLFKRQAGGGDGEQDVEDARNQKKREILLAGGTIYEDSYANEEASDGQDGLAIIGGNQYILSEQQKEEEKEPAEAESRAVMNVCSGCDEEPFEKALVLGWRTTAKQIFSEAHYVAAIPKCGLF